MSLVIAPSPSLSTSPTQITKGAAVRAKLGSGSGLSCRNRQRQPKSTPRITASASRSSFIAFAPSIRRYPVLATTLYTAVISMAHGDGHAGTTPILTTTKPPGEEKASHLPFNSGIEYETTPMGAERLPPPDTHGHHHPSLEQVISNRRSCRTFAPPPTGLMHLYEVAQLCWAAQGITVGTHLSTAIIL